MVTSSKSNHTLTRLLQFSRDVLKEDFRVGLKDLDGMPLHSYHVQRLTCGLVDSAAEERDPDAFDPTVNLRSEHFRDHLACIGPNMVFRLRRN